MTVNTTSFELGFGSGVFFATRSDISDGTPYQVAALQDITVSFNGELKDLFSQGQYPIAVARGKVKIEGKGKFALVSTPLYNSLFFGGTVETGQILTAFAETHNIAATITVSNASTFSFDLGVYAPSSGQRWTLVDFVSGTVIAGTYKVDPTSGVYNFYTGDVPASPSVLPIQISYEYTAATGFTLTQGNPFMGTTPTFRGDFYQPYGNFSLTLTLFACVATSLAIPDGGVDNFLINDFAFGAFQSGTGNVFQLSTNQ
jgi:hypothetical protein